MANSSQTFWWLICALAACPRFQFSFRILISYFLPISESVTIDSTTVSIQKEEKMGWFYKLLSLSTVKMRSLTEILWVNVSPPSFSKVKWPPSKGSGSQTSWHLQEKVRETKMEEWGREVNGRKRADRGRDLTSRLWHSTSAQRREDLSDTEANAKVHLSPLLPQRPHSLNHRSLSSFATWFTNLLPLQRTGMWSNDFEKKKKIFCSILSWLDYEFYLKLFLWSLYFIFIQIKG